MESKYFQQALLKRLRSDGPEIYASAYGSGTGGCCQCMKGGYTLPPRPIPHPSMAHIAQEQSKVLSKSDWYHMDKNIRQVPMKLYIKPRLVGHERKLKMEEVERINKKALSEMKKGNNQFTRKNKKYVMGLKPESVEDDKFVYSLDIHNVSSLKPNIMEESNPERQPATHASRMSSVPHKSNKLVEKEQKNIRLSDDTRYNKSEFEDKETMDLINNYFNSFSPKDVVTNDTNIMDDLYKDFSPSDLKNMTDKELDIVVDHHLKDRDDGLDITEDIQMDSKRGNDMSLESAIKNMMDNPELPTTDSIFDKENIDEWAKGVINSVKDQLSQEELDELEELDFDDMKNLDDWIDEDKENELDEYDTYGLFDEEASGSGILGGKLKLPTRKIRSYLASQFKKKKDRIAKSIVEKFDDVKDKPVKISEIIRWFKGGAMPKSYRGKKSKSLKGGFSLKPVSKWLKNQFSRHAKRLVTILMNKAVDYATNPATLASVMSWLTSAASGSSVLKKKVKKNNRKKRQVVKAKKGKGLLSDLIKPVVKKVKSATTKQKQALSEWREFLNEFKAAVKKVQPNLSYRKILEMASREYKKL